MTEFNHEDIKNLVSRILDYYGFNDISEYSINGKRIDLVVMDPSNNSILMGIEIEITSALKKDIENLEVLNPKYKVIIGPYVTKVKNRITGIECFNIPSENDKEFENYLREKFPNNSKKPYYFPLRKIVMETMGKTDLLSHFKKLISNQNLDYKIARDIIYKTYVGGMIKVGKMQKQIYGYFMAYNKDLPKEYKFLKAFGYFVEEVAYTPELPIISMLKTDNDKFRQLASEIAYEVIEEKRNDIEKIFNKYNKSFIFCSLYGNNFDFSYDIYQYYQISGSIVRIPFTFDINKEDSYFWKLKIVCSFIDILNKIEQLYKELQEIDIGVMTETYHGYKGSYENPLQSSITHIKVPEELLNIIRDYNDFDESLLNKFVSYAIVYEYKNVVLDHADNAKNFQQLINNLGIDFELIKEVISELSNKGFTSNLVFDFNQSEDNLGKPKNLFAIYDEINLKEYIRQRMKEILTDAQIL